MAAVTEMAPGDERNLMVTALRPDRKDPVRKAVYLDGKYAFSLHVDRIAELGIREGDSVSEAVLEAAQQVAGNERARAKALDLLAVRSRSQREMQERLQRSRFSPETIRATVEWLQRLGYLDDRRFAQEWIRSRQRTRPMGRRRLQEELRAKGVARETIEAELHEHQVADDEVEVATALAMRRVRRYRRLPSQEAKRKLSGFLVRRGFSYDVVRQAVDAALGDHPG